MLNYPASEARRNLFLQMMQTKYNITEPNHLHFLEEYLTEDGEGFFLQNDLFLNYASNGVPFQRIGLPQEAYEDGENWYYYPLTAIHIPSLLPYVNHPSFIDFTYKIQAEIMGDFQGNRVEFFYLPTSQYSLSDKKELRQFANRPASFMIGIQDQGGLNFDTYYEFFNELESAFESIKQLIKGREQAA